MSIKIENLTHVYMPKSPFEKKALDNVNLVIEDGEFLALIGHTGSGNSTFKWFIRTYFRKNIS